MHRLPIEIRRARRTDLQPVLTLCGIDIRGDATAERRLRRRYRRLVSDLGTDVYVAVDGHRIVGFVHVSYTRRLPATALARVETLEVDSTSPHDDLESQLVRFAVARARKKGCAEIQMPADLSSAGCRWKPLALQRSPLKD